MEGFDRLAKASWSFFLVAAVVYGGLMLIAAVRNGTLIDFTQLLSVVVLLLVGAHMRLVGRVADLQNAMRQKGRAKR